MKRKCADNLFITIFNIIMAKILCSKGPTFSKKNLESELSGIIQIYTSSSKYLQIIFFEITFKGFIKMSRAYKLLITTLNIVMVIVNYLLLCTYIHIVSLIPTKFNEIPC